MKPPLKNPSELAGIGLYSDFMSLLVPGLKHKHPATWLTWLVHPGHRQRAKAYSRLIQIIYIHMYKYMFLYIYIHIHVHIYIYVYILCMEYPQQIWIINHLQIWDAHPSRSPVENLRMVVHSGHSRVWKGLKLPTSRLGVGYRSKNERDWNPIE